MLFHKISSSETHFPSLHLVFSANKQRHRERERGTELQSLELSGVKRRERWEWNTREGVEASKPGILPPAILENPVNFSLMVCKIYKSFLKALKKKN